MKDPVRILLYSHDSFGLGHLRRNMNIARSLVQASPEVNVLCLTGSPRPDLFPAAPGVDTVKLPSITKDENGHYVPRDLGGRLQPVLEIRGQAIKSVCASFRPHVFLVDHAPTGIGDELLPALETVHRQGDTAVMLGMRDILDSPSRAKAELQAKIDPVLRELYHRIIVYGDRRVFDFERECELPPDIGEKIRYVGYACHGAGEHPVRSAPNGTGRKHLLVHAGGGEDGMFLLQSMANYVCSAQSPFDQVTIVGGPLMDDEHKLSIATAVADDARVEFLSTTPSMEGHIRRSDLVVAMGGYNSVYEVLCQEKKLLIHPRTYPRREQDERARRLESMGLAGVLRENDLIEPRRIHARVVAMLQGAPPQPRDRGLVFDGGVRAAQRILALAHGASHTSLQAALAAEEA